ncbi:hypothetical protein BI347_14880 [Chromobacterium sphagni]|uniref:Carrier domain-containing protein n=1 Tax=Chromobacterium sphagni TaxID=1903179 RepID=A0A1S1X5C8_9NEIS|nr:hypothetical protein BI347_14880 [Chromobacterium sphagni]
MKSKRRVAPAASAQDEIAVIGLGCRFPQAENPLVFWDNLLQGKSAIGPVPEGRWRDPERAQPFRGGFIAEADCFDAMFFKISPKEAELMDPQQRILLEVLWHTMEDAGIRPSTLAGRKVGVFMGVCNNDYADLLNEYGRYETGLYGSTGTSGSILSNRVSFVYDLRGPSVTVDTACSSSLVAVHMAVKALRAGECEAALAGGANICWSQSRFLAFGSAGMLSPDGVCRTFDAQANGYVRGEGAGAVLLKPLSQAIRDGNPVYGLIKGGAINHGGRTRGLTVTSPEQQSRLLLDAYGDAGVPLDTVGYIEVHGTGTALGDPIEFLGLKQAFAAQAASRAEVGLPVSQAAGYCALGAVKTNIGHLEAAAGIAGLIKVLLALKHRSLPANLNFQALNSLIKLDGSPFSIPIETRSWPAMAQGPDLLPRRAGVSAFGYGGAYAHLVVEEWEPVAEEAVAEPDGLPQLIVLSAPNIGRLRAQAASLAAFLSQDGGRMALADLAYSLQIGREAFAERLAIVVSDVSILIARLNAFAAGADQVDDGFRGKAAREAAPPADLAADAAGPAWALVAERWVAGAAIDWQRRLDGRQRRLKALPLYPFERRRHWAAPAEQAGRQALSPAAAEPARSGKIFLQPLVPAVDGEAGRVAGCQRAAAEARVDVARAVVPVSAVSVAADGERLAELVRVLTGSLAEALYMDVGELEADRPFSELGLDSIVGVEWSRAINKTFGLKLPATRLYDYPSIRRLADYLLSLLADAGAAGGATAEPPMAGAAGASAPDAGLSLAELEQALKASLAEALYMDPAEIDAERPFSELGLDSIVGVEWARAINKRYRLALPATRLYDYCSIRRLAAHLAQDCGVKHPQAAASAAGSGAAPADGDRALVVTTVHTLDEVELSAWRVPAPGRGEVAVAVRASAINFPDAMCVQGLYPTMPAYPFVPGFEVAGVVSRLGEGVDGIAVGDEVIALTGAGMGGHASQVNVPAANVIRKPANLSFEEACSLPVVFLTAHHAFEAARLSRGESVLIQTATGGCGLAAIQLARLRGAVVSGTSSKEDKLETLRRLGLEHALNYRTAFDRELRKRTDGRGVDVVLNMLSGAAIQQGLNCLAPCGRYLEIAVQALRTSQPLDLSRLVENQSFHSIDLRRLALENGQAWAEAFAPLLRLFETGLLLPVVSRIYPLAKIKEALAFVASGKHIGKVVISHAAEQVIDRAEQCVQGMLDQWRRAAEAAGAAPAAGGAKPASDDIAIIGVSGAFPGAKTLDEFWDMLVGGRDCISEVPARRWAMAGCYDPRPGTPGRSYSKWMGVLEEADCFDPLFFNISPFEAQWMDPQQRLFLEHGWSCIESAGIDPDSLSGSGCGVYVGCVQGEYGRAGGQAGLTAQGLMGGSSSILAARIAYHLNLKGPCLAIDTACSSSLVAIAEACDSLTLGRVDLALVGGVSVLAGPELHIMASDAGMLSSGGRCFTFDARADGFVPGEGVGVLLLKRLADALRDRDICHGVIKGWGVNQDGRTNGITAPSVSSQAALQKQVYQRFAIDPATISLVEAHGTGTKLGDPIEVEALTESFRSHTDRRGYCAMGSVKSNIGHLLAAAGVSGVIKTLLAMRHRMLPPTIHFSALNPHLALDDSPFYVNTELSPWPAPAGRPRRAAVSSFGFSGTNAHLVLEEAPPPPPWRSVAGSALIVLSAKTGEQLRAYAGRLADWLRAQPAVDLAALAHTLQSGRAALRHRLAFVGHSREQIADALADFAAGREVAQLAVGEAKPGAAARAAEMDAEPQRLAQDWVRGAVAGWPTPVGGRPPRLSLPTYPFARERYWVAAAAESEESASKERASTVSLLARGWEAAAAGAARRFGQRRVLLDAACAGRAPARDAAGQALHCETLADGGNDAAERFGASLEHVFRQVQDLLRSGLEDGALLQVVLADDGEDGWLRQGLSGLLNSASLEHPGLQTQLIRVDPAADAGALAEALQAGAERPAQRELRHGRDGCRAATLRPLAAVGEPSLPWREGGVYLITGGLGGLGLLFAREILAQLQDATVILTGRSALDDGRRRQVAALGARVAYQALDVADGAAVQACVQGLLARHGRLNGVLHAAGVLRDGFLLNKRVDDLRAVLAPKVAGLVHLDRATAVQPLDFFAVFSSIAGVFGNVGQGDYASANAFMDAYAERRAAQVAAGARQGRTVSLCWPLWAEGGMRLDAAGEAALAAAGLTPLATRPGLDAFYRALAQHEHARLVVLSGDGALSRPAEPAPERHTEPAALQARTLRQLKKLFAGVTQVAVDRLDANEALECYGIDSVLITRLNRELESIFGGLSKTLWFEYRTLGALAAYLSAQRPEACLRWSGGETAAQPAAGPTAPMRREAMPAPTPTRPDGGAAIAIIGLSGRYPQARTLEQYWDNLQSGRDCISEIPVERWALDSFYCADPEQAVANGKSYSKWGGFVDGFAEFDPLFFNISPAEAEGMDPQERLFLQSCWDVLEDAGYTRERLARVHDGRVGVFAGITKTGFDLYGPALWRQGTAVFPHTSFSSVANRVSYFLNLNGPSLPIDTMCSSSLTAIHEACEHLRRDECELAIAGGVNLYLHSSNYVMLCMARMLSRDGQCRSFGAGGNGFVPGEGVGAVLLKPLARAEADGDRIHGVIKSSGINHGGKTHGYTVPNPGAQRQLIADAIAKAGIDARAISYVEAHGTGTELGDPIEVAGLSQAFQAQTADTQFCALGSVKSNIGHGESAAGIAGLTKVLLQMRHGQLAPSLHADTLNPHIDFAGSPFFVQRELQEWKRPLLTVDGVEREYPRIAGISSFGAGGANAHVIVEEYVDRRSWPAIAGPAAIVLSARTEAELRTRAQQLLAAIGGWGEGDLASVAATLQLGREAMEHRLALLVDGIGELAGKLEAHLRGDAEVEGRWQGEVRRGKDGLAVFAEDEDLSLALEAWMGKKKYDRLLELWVKGLALDWGRLYPQGLPARISLPGYPFKRERYWVAAAETAAVETARRLHPLVHENASTVYRSASAAFRRRRVLPDGPRGARPAGAAGGGLSGNGARGGADGDAAGRRGRAGDRAQPRDVEPAHRSG